MEFTCADAGRTESENRPESSFHKIFYFKRCDLCRETHAVRFITTTAEIRIDHKCVYGLFRTADSCWRPGVKRSDVYILYTDLVIVVAGLHSIQYELEGNALPHTAKRTHREKDTIPDNDRWILIFYTVCVQKDVRSKLYPYGIHFEMK